MSDFQPTPEFFERLPTAPGVYLMKDAAGKVVYVGKAKNLRTRVRQYFRPGGDDRFFIVAGLLARALAGIETVVVDTEKEALLLENHLIKKHQPRFNVLLRDDKQYLVLRVDPTSNYPRVEVVRNIKDDRARYFGPYHSASSARETLRTLNRFFQLRTCTDHVLANRTRPCLQYQIKRCPGPCVYPIDKVVYGEQVEDVMMFLGGKSDELVRRLRERMKDKAAAEEFEAAAQLRDSLLAVEKSVSAQNIVQDDFVDQDVFGMWRDGDIAEITVLHVRAGKLVGRRSHRVREQEFPNAEVIENFVQQYYELGAQVPDEVIVPCEFDGAEVLAEWLGGKRGKKVRVWVPRRGQRVKLLALANKNAAASAASRQNRDEDTHAALVKLQSRLGVRRFPSRIECFDIAHLQGTATVASMVVFVDGVAETKLYRSFKVKSVTNDDFASMYEVLSRRFKRAKDGAGTDWQAPDLLVIDGGKGQLGMAIAALTDLGIPLGGDEGVEVIGLAKEREDTAGTDQPDRVFRRNVKEPILLRPNTTELYLLSRIRDEAHRFANTFHKKTRSKQTLRSALDSIPGIGPSRRKTLLRHFGSVRAVREASVESIASVEGISAAVAAAIHAHLKKA